MRSTNAIDYQDVARAVAAMAKEYPRNSEGSSHSHTRGQLLYAIKGLMVAKTAEDAWIIPPGYAFWIPPETMHSVEMRAPVSMRTVYIRRAEAAAISANCKVIAVPALLRETILALLEEPIDYCEEGRGGALAKLVIDEIARAAAAAFELPLPRDKRLATICASLIQRPSLSFGVDDWALEAGMSRRTFTRKFRHETGLSFGTWRRRLRSLNAAAQLSEGVLPSIAAWRTGYANASALRAMMRRG